MPNDAVQRLIELVERATRTRNRKENLRLCTLTENSRHRRPVARNNTTGYRGVSFRRSENVYVAYIKVGDTQIHLGRYKTAPAAGRAREKAEKQYYGAFAG